MTTETETVATPEPDLDDVPSAILLSYLDDDELIDELEARGFYLPDPNELDALHYEFFDNPERAAQHARELIRRLTGRP